MDHVEECPSYYVDCLGTICDCDYMHICICPELRACERRLMEWMRSTIVERIFDLESCQKDDDCRTLAQGADLALSDVLYDYRRQQ